MKRSVTKSFSKENSVRRIYLFTFLFLIITLFIHNPVYPQSGQSNSNSLTPDKSFTFKEDGSLWKVDFNDNEISALYKDGVRIYEDEIDQYRDMIFKNLYELSFKGRNKNYSIKKFYFDPDSLKKNMDEFLKHFDKKAFKDNMKGLTELLEELKNNRKDFYYFNPKEFREKMKELQKYFKSKPFFPFPFELDKEVFLEIKQLKTYIRSLDQKSTEITASL